jgi:hypothetical protein
MRSRVQLFAACTIKGGTRKKIREILVTHVYSVLINCFNIALGTDVLHVILLLLFAISILFFFLILTILIIRIEFNLIFLF